MGIQSSLKNLGLAGLGIGRQRQEGAGLGDQKRSGNEDYMSEIPSKQGSQCSR
jgi:hypothetical protein